MANLSYWMKYMQKKISSKWILCFAGRKSPSSRSERCAPIMPGFKGVGPKSSECENSGLLRLQRLAGLWGLLKNSNWTLLSLWTIGNLMRLLRLALHQMISRVFSLHFSLFFLQILFLLNFDWFNLASDVEMVFVVVALFFILFYFCTNLWSYPRPWKLCGPNCIHTVFPIHLIRKVEDIIYIMFYVSYKMRIGKKI